MVCCCVAVLVLVDPISRRFGGGQCTETAVRGLAAPPGIEKVGFITRIELLDAKVLLESGPTW